MAASRCRKRAVNSCAVTCLSGNSSLGVTRVQAANRKVAMHRPTKQGSHFFLLSSAPHRSRDRSESTARSPSTEPGLSPTPLRQHHIQCLSHFVNTDQLHTVQGVQLRQISFRQNASPEPHLGGFANAQFGLADGTYLSAQAYLPQQ